MSTRRTPGKVNTVSFTDDQEKDKHKPIPICFPSVKGSENVLLNPIKAPRIYVSKELREQLKWNDEI